jgi:hypothetical protein
VEVVGSVVVDFFGCTKRAIWSLMSPIDRSKVEISSFIMAILLADSASMLVSLPAKIINITPLTKAVIMTTRIRFDLVCNRSTRRSISNIKGATPSKSRCSISASVLLLPMAVQYTRFHQIRNLRRVTTNNDSTAENRYES